MHSDLAVCLIAGSLKRQLSDQLDDGALVAIDECHCGSGAIVYGNARAEGLDLALVEARVYERKGGLEIG